MDDKTKKDLLDLLDQLFEKKFIPLFNQGFEEVVLPKFVEIEERLDNIEGRLNRVEAEIVSLRNRMEQMDRKLDIFTDKVMVQEVRLKAIESVPAIAHQIKK